MTFNLPMERVAAAGCTDTTTALGAFAELNVEVMRLKRSHDALLAAAEMSLEWLNNLVAEFGMVPVVNQLPNGTGGRVTLIRVIKEATNG